MNITKHASMIIALLAALFTIPALGTHVFAQETGRLRHDLPAESYTACDGKSAEDYAMVANHQITERGSNDKVGQADTPQNGGTGNLIDPVNDYIVGPSWQQVSGNSRYALADATAYPGLLPLDSGSDLRRYSLKESLSISNPEPGAHYIDLTRYKLVTFKEKEGPYWYSNFNDFEADHEGIDAEYRVNLLTIDTQGNISGITGLMMGMLR